MAFASSINRPGLQGTMTRGRTMSRAFSCTGGLSSLSAAWTSHLRKHPERLGSPHRHSLLPSCSWASSLAKCSRISTSIRWNVKVGKQLENDFIQLWIPASWTSSRRMGKKDHAIFLDYCNAGVWAVLLNSATIVSWLWTRINELADSKYNERFAETHITCWRNYKSMWLSRKPWGTSPSISSMSWSITLSSELFVKRARHALIGNGRCLRHVS